MNAREAAIERDKVARQRLADDPVHQIKQRRALHEDQLSDRAMEAIWDRTPCRTVLTAVERDVLQLAADGFANPEIAARLFKSTHTVKSQMKSMFRLLGARDRANAVAIAIRQGLID